MSDLTIEEYVEDYVMEDGEGGCYTPNEKERAILLDAIYGVEDTCFSETHNTIKDQAQQIQSLTKQVEALKGSYHKSVDTISAQTLQIDELQARNGELVNTLERAWSMLGTDRPIGDTTGLIALTLNQQPDVEAYRLKEAVVEAALAMDLTNTMDEEVDQLVTLSLASDKYQDYIDTNANKEGE